MCRLLMILWVLVMSIGAGATAEESKISYSTGGILRLPNTQLPSDDDNAMFEGWLKAGVTILDSTHGKIILSLRAKYISDTAEYAFNNSTTFGVEIAYKARLGKRASLTLKLRQDWSAREDGVNRNGLRFIADYFFLNYATADRDARMLGLKVKARILKIYGTLTYPETLVSDDDNITMSGGINYSANLNIPNTRLKLAPYVGLHLAFDEVGLSYNNKAQPSIGIKIKRPLPNGDIHLGMRYQVDYRWKSNRVERGPGVFIGWYSAF